MFAVDLFNMIDDIISDTTKVDGVSSSMNNYQNTVVDDQHASQHEEDTHQVP